MQLIFILSNWTLYGSLRCKPWPGFLRAIRFVSAICRAGLQGFLDYIRGGIPVVRLRYWTASNDGMVAIYSLPIESCAFTL